MDAKERKYYTLSVPISIFAHRIIYDDKEYTMSVVDINMNGDIYIKPFEKETHSTLFFNGRIKIIGNPKDKTVTIISPF